MEAEQKAKEKAVQRVKEEEEQKVQDEVAQKAKRRRCVKLFNGLSKS